MKRIRGDGRTDWGRERRRDDAPATVGRDGTSTWRREGDPGTKGLPWQLAPDGGRDETDRAAAAALLLGGHR
jgi:hypothetical protein